MFKLTGTVKAIMDTIQVSEKFSKREFVVTDSSSMYPQDILFQLTQDKCSMIDAVAVNDTVEVSFNLRGREWVSPQGEVKYFNTLDAWRVEKVGQGNAMPQGGPSAMSFNPTPSPIETATTEQEDDDLPF
ncbi:MAG TPA: DUF3127 domain-containing protein [Taishania sp.]|nr:DUF3127 domain-containing protein [Taishania sp.]